jgi:imidazolonepropionase-like amidohydrolase
MLRYLFFILFLPFFALSQMPSTAIKNVNIVDVEKGVVKRNQTIVIEDGRIKAIGTNTAIPKDAVQINGKGKYLMPGLWDMHFHMWDIIEDGWEINEKVSLPLFLANGVTGVRYMYGNSGLLDLRNRINAGNTQGPRLIISSPILKGTPSKVTAMYHIRDTTHARSSIDSFARMGYDLIKVYTCWPDRAVFFAVAEACRRNHLPFAGHVPATVTAGEAIEAGMSSLEHLHGIREAYASNEAELVRFNADVCINKRSLFNALDSITSSMVNFFDQRQGDKLARLIKAKNAFATPTQFFQNYLEKADKMDSVAKADNLYNRYTPTALKEVFIKSLIPPSQVATIVTAQKKENAYARKVILHLYQQGVPLLIGTDGPNIALVPGFSVHQEMETLVKIGVSTRAVLQAATINPARNLGLDKRLGSVSTGKEADLLLLDSNPLLNIKNTRKINAVIVRGKLLSRKELDDILQAVELQCK